MRRDWCPATLWITFLVSATASHTVTSPSRSLGMLYNFTPTKTVQENVTVELVKRVGSGPSSPTRASGSGTKPSYSSPTRATSPRESPRGPPNSPVLSPLSSPGSHSASPKSYRSQPSSPSSNEGSPQTVYVLSQRPTKKWDPWFKKERGFTKIIENPKKIQNPAESRDPESRAHKTVFYGAQAREWIKSKRPAILRSQEGRMKKKIKDNVKFAIKKMNKEYQ